LRIEMHVCLSSGRKRDAAHLDDAFIAWGVTGPVLSGPAISSSTPSRRVLADLSIALTHDVPECDVDLRTGSGRCRVLTRDGTSLRLFGWLVIVERGAGVVEKGSGLGIANETTD
jgi:hypothetical protein